jgi:predicted RNA-binding protein YlxR (DUF448 family)
MVPVRTCIGCRREVAQDKAIRLALTAAQNAETTPPLVVWDTDRALPGRGAWLHRQRECLETALKRKAFNRAFRRSVDPRQLDLHDIIGTDG